MRRSTRAAVLAAATLAVTAAVAGLVTWGLLEQERVSLTAADVAVDAGVYREALAQCLARADGDDPGGCAVRLVGLALDSGDLGAALGLLREGTAQNAAVTPLCHDAAHQAGAWARAQGMPLPEAYRVAFPDCRFGFYHGAMTEHVRALDLPQLLAALPGLCDGFPTPEGRGECVHATGHVLFDRAVDDIEKALDQCTAHPQEETQGRCVEGVFMQAMEVSRPGVANPSPDDAALVARLWGSTPDQQERRLTLWCANLDGPSARTCWNSTPQVLGVLWQGNWAELARVCSGAPDPMDRSCFEGIAAAAFTVESWDPRGIARACHASTDERSRWCMRSMAVTFAVQDDPARAQQVCQLARPHEQQACQEGLRDGALLREGLGPAA